MLASGNRTANINRSMRKAVIVATVRTPLAKSFRGSLNRTRPDEMLATCIRHLMGKAPGLKAEEVEDVIIGCATQVGAQGYNVARIAAIRAGLPASVAGITINRFCSSGMEAVAMAAHEIVHEGAEVAIGGGVESLTESLEAWQKPEANTWISENNPGIYMAMGDTAEVVARRYKISRRAQDEYALASQQRTAAAQDSGFFDDEIMPMDVRRALIERKTGKATGEEDHHFSRDECNRPDTTMEGLRALKPFLNPDGGEGSVTAGNASQLSDGASVNLLMSVEKAAALGLQPKVAFRGLAVAGCEPDEMGIGPVFAVPKLLKRQGLTVADIDLWELNEAFAVQVVHCRDRLGIPMDRLNVNGGSIAVGHPFGMTGARLVGSLANEMQRRQVRYGVVTMCVGGGQGAAGLFELCS